MPVSRRDFLKMAGLGLVGSGLPAAPLKAIARSVAADNSFSMLYDATKCVGCRACQVACKRRSGLPAEPDAQGMYEAPSDLSASTWTMIKLARENGASSFVKNQCMHCLEPACVSVCPVAALEKLESGPVVYHGERCIGCRYCMAACPFGIPKSQWEENLPLIQKCDFCADRLAKGEPPACGEVCPTGALIYGTRSEMLGTAHARLASDENYIQEVYGESEVGGTSMLYIAGVGFDALGFPQLKDAPLTAITWPYMRAVPAVIAVMASLSTAIYFRTHRGNSKKNGEEAGNGSKD